MNHYSGNLTSEIVAFVEDMLRKHGIVSYGQSQEGISQNTLSTATTVNTKRNLATNKSI